MAARQAGMILTEGDQMVNIGPIQGNPLITEIEMTGAGLHIEKHMMTGAEP